jgi:hypothetical protein
LPINTLLGTFYNLFDIRHDESRAFGWTSGLMFLILFSQILFANLASQWVPSITAREIRYIRNQSAKKNLREMRGPSYSDRDEHLRAEINGSPV